MTPDNLKFGGGYDGTTIHPVVFLAMLIALAVMLFAKRRLTIVPLLFLGFLVPYGQQIYVGGQHLSVLRILIMAGVARMIVSKRKRLNAIDKLFILWALLRALAFMLLFRETAAVVNQIAFLLDYLGGFFLLRSVITTQDDVRLAIRTLVVVAVVLAAGMLTERTRNINPFGYIGGVLTTTIREGKIRAQGPFAHPLLAGTFGATLLPLCGWLWLEGKSRGLAVAGMVSSTIVTLTSASSTSVLAYVAGILATFCWPLRNHLGLFRWGGVAILTMLHLVMKAPVWFLIARIDLVGGSSGHHRAMLIDQFITHFADWWLIGTNDNGNWGFDMWDTCNQFVTEGYTGGLMTFICFIALLRLCFLRVAAARRRSTQTPRQEWMFWLLGITLVSHIVAFFGIVYFDQTRISWFTILAIVAALPLPGAAPVMVPATALTARNSERFGSREPAADTVPVLKW